MSSDSSFVPFSSDDDKTAYRLLASITITELPEWATRFLEEYPDIESQPDTDLTLSRLEKDREFFFPLHSLLIHLAMHE